MNTTWRTELPHWVLLAAMFGLAAITWPSAPDAIPVHWNLAGQPDRYASRLEGLLALPVIALGTYVLMRVLPWADPRRASYARFKRAYSAIRLAVLGFLALIYGVIHLWLRGIQVDLGTVLPIGMGVLFLVVGAAMPRIRPNWLVGIRNPWTLTDEIVWTRTHEVGGALFMLVGGLSIVLGVLSPRFALSAAIGMLLLVAMAVTVYSYVIWRRDQRERHTAT